MSIESALGGNLLVLLLVVIPGFIMMKVYDLIVPGERRDFSKALLAVLVFGCMNCAIIYWPYLYISKLGFVQDRPIIHYLLVILLLFGTPILWPILWCQLTERIGWIRDRIVPPRVSAWDWFFLASTRAKSKYWIIVHLKDGRKVAGRYGDYSFVSSSPGRQEIYLDEVWELDETDGAFKHKVPYTRGILLLNDSFTMVEFFAEQGEPPNGQKSGRRRAGD